MSYLHLPSINLADFSKGTISLWFRFSNDSIQKALAYGAGYSPPDGGDFATGPDVFRTTIPLVTFGRKVMATMWGSVGHFWPFPTGGIGAATFDSVDKGEAPCEPSHLGLVVNQVIGGVLREGVFLKMIFQTNTRAQVQGLVTEATNIHWELEEASGHYLRYDVVKDISYTRTPAPEQFEIIPQFAVNADKWHHLLLSFDFSTSVDVVALKNYTGDDAKRDAIRSFCKFWYAFDDQNKDGEDNMGYGWAHHGPNDVIPVSAVQAAFDYHATPPDIDSSGRPFVTGELYAPEYHWAASPIPMNHGSVGLPASTEYVDTIYHCEMGEFQFFAGLALDTNEENSRRAFVAADGRPVKPADTETMLGRRPDILLHGTNNWKQGKNTGSTGIEITTAGDAVIIPAGQFQHIGLIKKYTPDPKLSEDSTA